MEASGGNVETAAIRRNLPTFGIAVDRLLGMQIVMGPPGSIGLRSAISWAKCKKRK